MTNECIETACHVKTERAGEYCGSCKSEFFIPRNSERSDSGDEVGAIDGGGADDRPLEKRTIAHTPQDGKLYTREAWGYYVDGNFVEVDIDDEMNATHGESPSYEGHMRDYVNGELSHTRTYQEYHAPLRRTDERK